MPLPGRDDTFATVGNGLADREPPGASAFQPESVGNLETMRESWTPTEIEGVLRRTTTVVGDERGAFSELWRHSLTAPLEMDPFVQSNLSRSREGVLRGMHFHRRQADLWILIEGRVLTATSDLRGLLRDGAGTPPTQLLELMPGDQLYIPRLVAHGFWALEETALVYLVSNEYDGTDEYGFAWDDPVAAIDWPRREPILSERDRQNPPLHDVIATLGQQTAGK